MGVVIKETIKTSIINYLGVIIGAFNVLWLQTSILTEVEIGIIKYYFDLSILIVPFLIIGINSLPSRFLHRFKTPQEENGFISFTLIIPAFLFVIFILYFHLSIYYDLFVFTQDTIDEEYIVPFLFLVFGNVYLQIFEGFFLAISKVFILSILKDLVIRVMFTLLLLLYVSGIIDFYSLFLIYTLLFLGELAILARYFLKLKSYSFNLSFFSHPIKREVIKYSLFLMVGIGGVILMAKLDTLMIHEFLISDKDVYGYIGIYSISFFIASIIEIPVKIMLQLLFPLMSKVVTEKKMNKLEEIYRMSAINGVLITVFCFLLIWYNLDLLFRIIPNGDIYAEGKYVVLFIGLAKILNIFFGYSHGVLSSTKHYRFSLYLFPLLLGLTVFFNYTFIPIYGIVGAALATALTVFIYSFVRYIVVYRLLKMNSLTIKHLTFLIITLVTVIVFEIKPALFINPFLEIVFNTIVLTFLFISLVVSMSVSKELNETFNTIMSKIKKTN